MAGHVSTGQVAAGHVAAGGRTGASLGGYGTIVPEF